MSRSFDRRTARLLLRLHSRESRERYGDEIVELFAERLAQDRGRRTAASRFWRWCRASADLALSGLLERWSRRSASPTGSGRGGGRGNGNADGKPWSAGSRRDGLLAETLADLRVAARVLRRQPAFTLVAVLALAVGLAGNAVMFGVVDGLLLEPLPFEHAERLMRLDETWRDEDRSVAYLNFLDWRRESRAFDRMAAVAGWSFALHSPGGAPRIVSGALVSGDLLGVLGEEPLLGRGFAPDDFSPVAPRVAWIGEGLWRERFAAETDVVGRSITLDGETYTVSGVLPQSFRYPSESRQVWIPAERVLDRRDLEDRDSHPGLHVLARLAPTATSAEAADEMARIARGLAELHPDSNEDHGVRLLPLREVYVGSVRPTFVALTIAVGLVLLIACANVANLLLSRASTRRAEMAIRTSLGAPRLRLIRQLLAESLLIAALSAGFGLLLAAWGMGAARAILSDSLRLFAVERVTLDHRVLLITLAAATLTAVLFGLAPALRATRRSSDPRSPTTGAPGSRGSATLHASARLQSLLVAGQVGVSMVLLIATVSMLASISRLRSADLGFDPRHVSTFEIDLAGERFAEPESTVELFDRLESEIAALPGVEAVGAVRPLPLSGSNRQSGIALLDSPVRAPDEPLRTDWGWIRPGYLEALRIPLLEGRGIEPTDDLDGRPVVLVDQTLARAMYPDGALGRRIHFAEAEWEIVGVVGAVRHYGVRQETRYQLYVPQAQRPTSALVYTVRASTDPESLAAAIRDRLSRLAPDQPFDGVRSLDSLVQRMVAREALLTLMLRLFTGVAVALAVLGLYGVLAYFVTLRRPEIGLRLAIGATGGDVIRQIAGRGLALAALGIAAGLLAAPLATRALSSQLFGVAPIDLPIFLGCAALFLLTALAAALIPAWRASRVNPVIVLSEG
ncbi:MAG TPA: ABC transporter permease [Thermoanaerobaculia bacterium]|nr:ABC transporter permease [Thermoanaerobaculia bacterium]